jgi:RNA polymerase sigma-70 factor (ECF subfamily)
MSFSEANSQEAAERNRASAALDRAAIDRLLGEHRAYLCRVASARLSGHLQRRIDASDIVQEAQAEAYRRYGAFLENAQVPLKIWLRKLVIERLIMAQRRHVGAAARSVNREAVAEGTAVDIARELLADQTSPSQIVSRQESVERIRNALNQLGEADREIVLMHLYEGLNSRESAAALGIEPAAARKRLARALQRMRKLLEVQATDDNLP